MTVRNRVEIMHGVNFDQLGRRDPLQYGDLTFTQLENLIAREAAELGLTPRFFQTNHEGEFVEHLHRLDGVADAIVLNPGAWTHYSYAIRDALDLTALPAIEIHLSDIHAREDFRKVSVFDGLVLEQITGRGPDGYRPALERIKRELEAAA
jgi:3-dehydroquinate dehydratase-2